MDRSWINTPRISDAYEKGVEEFLQFAQHNAISNHNGVNKVSLCQLFAWKDIECFRN